MPHILGRARSTSRRRRLAPSMGTPRHGVSCDDLTPLFPSLFFFLRRRTTALFVPTPARIDRGDVRRLCFTRDEPYQTRQARRSHRLETLAPSLPRTVAVGAHARASDASAAAFFTFRRRCQRRRPEESTARACTRVTSLGVEGYLYPTLASAVAVGRYRERIGGSIRSDPHPPCAGCVGGMAWHGRLAGGRGARRGALAETVRASATARAGSLSGHIARLETGRRETTVACVDRDHQLLAGGCSSRRSRTRASHLLGCAGSLSGCGQGLLRSRSARQCSLRFRK